MSQVGFYSLEGGFHSFISEIFLVEVIGILSEFELYFDCEVYWFCAFCVNAYVEPVDLFFSDSREDALSGCLLGYLADFLNLIIGKLGQANVCHDLIHPSRLTQRAETEM